MRPQVPTRGYRLWRRRTASCRRASQSGSRSSSDPRMSQQRVRWRLVVRPPRMSRRRLVPSTSIRQTSYAKERKPGARVRRKTRSPSGVKLGCASSTRSRVRRRSPDPSLSTSQISASGIARAPASSGASPPPGTKASAVAATSPTPIWLALTTRRASLTRRTAAEVPSLCFITGAPRPQNRGREPRTRTCLRHRGVHGLTLWDSRRLSPSARPTVGRRASLSAHVRLGGLASTRARRRCRPSRCRPWR